MASTESVKHGMDKPLSSGASHSLCLPNMFQSQLPLWRCSGDVPDMMRERAEEMTSSLAHQCQHCSTITQPWACPPPKAAGPLRGPQCCAMGSQGMWPDPGQEHELSWTYWLRQQQQPVHVQMCLGLSHCSIINKDVAGEKWNLGWKRREIPSPSLTLGP